MKLSVVALDYDGTFTREDRPKCIRARCGRGCAAAQCDIELLSDATLTPEKS